MRIQPPKHYRVKGFLPDIERQYQHRLLSMGFVPGEVVQAVRVAPMGDPIELKVGRAFVSIRRDELAWISFEEVDQ